MRTQAAPKESAAHATQPFFSARSTPGPAFFAPTVQMKCAGCAEEEMLQRQPETQERLVQAKCASCNDAPILQPKLSIGTPGDRFENEADQMANTVMRAPDPGAFAPQISALEPPRLQRDAAESCSVKDEPKAPNEEEEGTEDVHQDDQAAEAAAEADAATTPVSPKRDSGEVSPPGDMESRLDSSRGGGNSLAGDTRNFMETRFGYDFSGVRVHTGATSENLNRDVRSLAFTSGSDIYFGSGQYRPDTDSGKHLLAHELTHVVQQSGSRGDGVVREKSDPNTIAMAREDKPYYGGSWGSGTATHGLIERMLRDHDKQLVTEAAIPGANRFGPKLNLVGVADLYKSKPAHTVTGVKAQKDAETEDNFLNMDNTDSKGTQPAVDSSPSLTGTKAAGRTWVGDFPSEIWLGEIKPFSTSKLQAGMAQLFSYTAGYQAFVRQANKVNAGKTSAGITVHRLDLSIPDYLNLDNWETQHASTTAKSISGDKMTRLWIGSAGNGLYLYAALPAGGGAAPPKAYFDQLADMKSKVLVPLKEPAKKTDLMKRGIQRKTSDRGPSYWPDRARDWETARSTWGTAFRTYSKTADVKSHRDKIRFEKALGRHGRSLKAGEKKEVKDYKSLMFWSGRGGKLLGRVRFLLGGAWDKALAVFEQMKEKMTGIRSKVKGISDKALVKVGWASRLIQAVVAVCKVAFAAFITESFNFFAECFHSAMDKVIEKFQAELNERFGEEICRARKLFEDSKQKLEDEWGGVIRQVEALVEAIQNVKRWMDIATAAVDLIRIGVQIISCLSPPGLGCLWGLVAQLGIGAMVGIVVGTQWFNDKIITPNVRALLREYVAPSYQKMINWALGDSLKEYHCHVADDAIPSMKFEAQGGLADGSAELRAHRDAWEADNESEILKDLQTVFEKPGGKKVSRAELLELAKKIQDSKLSKEQLKELIERTRNPATGKLKLESAVHEAGSEQMPPAPVPKVRNIDYPIARRQNAVYQKMRAWDPATFVKQPDISFEAAQEKFLAALRADSAAVEGRVLVDSDEFANAVYDMQEALHLKADGILGDETLIAFYDRNKKKPDLFYKEATKAIEEKKVADAERAANAKAAKDKAAADKGGGGQPVAVPAALPPSVKVINANQAVPDNQSEVVPKGINIQIAPSAWALMTWTDQPRREYKMKSTPSYVSLDIHVNQKHEYRIEYVAVKKIYIANLYGAGCYWNLALDMQDGIKVQTSNGPLVKLSMMWCLPEEKQ